MGHQEPAAYVLLLEVKAPGPLCSSEAKGGPGSKPAAVAAALEQPEARFQGAGWVGVTKSNAGSQDCGRHTCDSKEGKR